jgi:hypothetical protein
VVTAQWPDIGRNLAYVRPCTSGKIFKGKPCRGFELCRLELCSKCSNCVCVCLFVCVCVRACVRASVIPPIAMFPHNQSGYFSGNTSGRRPVWNLFGLPATKIDIDRGFPQSVHMNFGVVFE